MDAQSSYYKSLKINVLAQRVKDVKFNRDPSSLPLTIIGKVLWLMGTARNAIVVVLASGAAAIFELYDMYPFTLTEKIDARLPPFKPPSFEVHNGNSTMGPGEIFSVSLVVII
jgi:sodium-independent sulfate anion transporter 11